MVGRRHFYFPRSIVVPLLKELHTLTGDFFVSLSLSHLYTVACCLFFEHFLDEADLPIL